MVKNGALRLARVGGVDVFIHWSWLIIVFIYSQDLGNVFSSKYWVAAQIAVFIAMVGFCEGMKIAFGKMAGGTVSEMTISFLGRGSNMVTPQRPGPIMLTNFGPILACVVMLAPTGMFFWTAFVEKRWTADAAHFAWFTLILNVVLLGWTAAPVYPLAGGRILRALLWLMMGRERSLQVACVLGLVGTVGLVAAAIWMQSIWWGIGALVVGMQCIAGFREAKMLNFMKALPRREDVTCPHCQQHPLMVTTIYCPCGEQLDPFDSRGQCASCGSVTAIMACPMCLQRSAIVEWFGPVGMFEVETTKGEPPVDAGGGG